MSKTLEICICMGFGGEFTKIVVENQWKPVVFEILMEILPLYRIFFEVFHIFRKTLNSKLGNIEHLHL